MQAFQDVTVTPFEELMATVHGGSPHRGGPRWPDWSGQIEARHNRAGKPVDAEPTPIAATRRLEAAAWGGPIAKHFGHQIADFSTRLLGTVLALPGMPILFATKPDYGYDDIAQAPSYVAEILDWFGVPVAARQLVTAPVLVSELYVDAQTEQLFGPGPTDAYISRLDQLTTERLGVDAAPRAGTTYVSRAGQQARFAGESYLEAVLTRSGVRVLRPETLSLADQLRHYRAAERLVFAEGSALHTLQLLGKLGSHVVVLNRRSRSRMAETSLVPRVAKLSYVDVSATLLHGLHPNGQPAMNYGMPVLDPDVLLDELEGLGIHARASWDEPAYAEARDRDINEWLAVESWRAVRSNPGSSQLILAALETPGLRHLRPQAESTLLTSAEPGGVRPGGQGSAGEDGRDLPVNSPAVRRINGLADALQARTYLEIGVAHGATFRNVRTPHRTGVDPHLRVPVDVLAGPSAELIQRASDEFFAGLGPQVTYDIVFIDGMHTFEHAYRDLCNALLHTHARSVIVIDDTKPSDVFSSLRDHGRALTLRKAEAGSEDPSWHGDVFKVVFAIHELHLGLDYVTVKDRGNPQTIVWRQATQRQPMGWSLEKISRMTYVDLLDSLSVLRLVSEDVAMERCLAALLHD